MTSVRRWACATVLLLTTGAGGAAVASPSGAAPTRPDADVPFVRRWLLLGPFPNFADDFLHRALVPESRVAPKLGSRTGHGRIWVEHRSSNDWVYPERTLGPFDWSGACAFTYLVVPADTPAVLWLGHDDAGRLYLDGDLVHEHHTHAATGGDAFGVPVHLSAGVHRLLVKVEDVEGDSGFCLRVARPDGRPAAVRPSLTPEGTDAEAAARSQPGFFSLDEIHRLLPLDSETHVRFDVPRSLERMPSAGACSHEWPRWCAFARGPGLRGPPAGFSGAVGVHPVSGGRTGARFHWKVRLPRADPTVVVRAAAEAGESRGAADSLLRIGLFDGEFRWLTEEPVRGEWTSVVATVPGREGTSVLLVLEAGFTGEPAWEELYIDEVEVR